jgi:single-stranded-DNA-specific exonuclease
MAKRWVPSGIKADCDLLARQWGVPPLVAQLLVNRGLAPGDRAETFLTPQLRDLHPPQALPGALEAASRIIKAIQNRERIVLYGDYDVDGTTGVAILWHMLKCAGADVGFYVPHRIEEGYGLNIDAVRRLIDEGARLIVSIDCGITATDVADLARAAGIGLIITDHHTPQDTIPKADVIVHPGLGSGYPNPNLCGAGVAFKLAWAIAQQLGDGERAIPEHRSLLMDLLPLAALGTIADVVPLIGENRIIARHGLMGLATTKLPGLVALIESAGIKSNRVSGYDVGFKLAPRLNAAGRMGHARLTVELFTRADTERAREIALYLEDHNRRRQSTDRQMAKQAFGLVERNGLAADTRRAIVLASEGWHAGVIGIVAARVVERYHRPAVLISLNNGEGQGSARSIRHFPLAEALAACGEHLISFGGHAMAAGLRIAPDRVEAFTDAFVSVANERLSAGDLAPRIRLDASVSLSELTLPTVEAIVSLGPFGMGNPKPKLATDWVELADEPRGVGAQGQHLQASFRQNGACIKGIGFGMGEAIDDLRRHRRCRVAFEPIINEFNGRRSAEMNILDLQFAE